MSSMPGRAVKHSPDRQQRRYARYRCECPVEVTLFSGDEHQRLSAHCRDLSEAGVGVLIAAELKLGEVVSLSFSLPGMPQSWDLRAVLRHRRRFHYGFEFLSLSAQQARTLKDYLPSLERADSEE